MRSVDSRTLEWLDALESETHPAVDVLDVAPDLTTDDAYALQFAMMKLKASRGDRIIGYKAAFTSLAMQQMFDTTEPMIGTLLQSGLYDEAVPIKLVNKLNLAEPEVLALLKHDLRGPGVNVIDVIHALEGLFPAIEIASHPPKDKPRSRQMGIARGKLIGGIVVGPQLTSARGLDLRLEGAVMSVNGVVQGSGTAVEALGNPFHVIAFIANKLSEFDQELKAGMVVLTGAVIKGAHVHPGDDVCVEFTHLGSVKARFSK